MPSIRTSGALTTFLPLLDNGIDQDRRRNSSRISGKPAISVVGAGLGCASPLQMGCWLTAATRDVEFAERGPGQFVCSNAVGPPTQPGRLGGAILARPELTDGILTADRDRLSFAGGAYGRFRSARASRRANQVAGHPDRSSAPTCL